jgi:hypothetical protein
MTKRWADVKQGIRPISEDEKREISELARLPRLLSQRRRVLGLTQEEVAEREGLLSPISLGLKMQEWFRAWIPL